jgi:hypothetical protein
METLEKIEQTKVQKLFGSKTGFVVYLLVVALFFLTVIFVAVQGSRGRLTSRQINGGITSIIILLFVMHLCMLFRSKLNVHMPVYIDIYVLFGSFGHMAGLLLDWYSLGFHWDVILHSTAGVLFGFIGFSFIPLFFGSKDVFSKKRVPIAFALPLQSGFPHLSRFFGKSLSLPSTPYILPSTPNVGWTPTPLIIIEAAD